MIIIKIIYVVIFIINCRNKIEPKQYSIEINVDLELAGSSKSDRDHISI